MIINRNTQLGLMYWDREVAMEYLDHGKILLDQLKENDEQKESGSSLLYNSSDELYSEIIKRLGYIPENKGTEFYTIKNPHPKYYLIQKSVLDYSKLIRISDNFSCVIFNKIKEGEHVYLLGKSEFFRFVKFNGVIKGMYWDRQNKIAFEVGFHLEKDRFYYPNIHEKIFDKIIQLITYVELGEIEVVLLESGRNNGKTKKNGKVTNHSEFNVYIVDSSWNKLIIRSEGFAVVGHFRLQPCGINHIDRKLIWIDAFEKHGYKRRPKAEIIHN